jgi:hypothetical protein
MRKQQPQNIDDKAEITVEVDKTPLWQTVEDMTDDVLTVQACNLVDKTGMGRRNCMIRMVNAKTNELAGTPAILNGYIVVNGDLMGE